MSGNSGDRGAGDHGTIMLDLAIVGGGPGGLMSAWYLKRKLGEVRFAHVVTKSHCGLPVSPAKYSKIPG